MDELAKRRWERNEDANAHSPLDAVKACLRKMEEGKKIEHVIIIHAVRADDGELTVGWYQAGNLPGFAQTGLVATAQAIMCERERI